METTINKSSTFPQLQSQDSSKQNGTAAVPIVRRVTNGILFSWHCLFIFCISIGALSITNTATFYLVSSKCELPNHPTQNISVIKGSKFTIAYLNDMIIEYCSVRPPFYKHEFHASKHLRISNLPSIDKGRIKIIIIQRWCKVVVKNALLKDQGQWELFIDSSDNHSKRKNQLYNVSLQYRPIFLNKPKNDNFARKDNYESTSAEPLRFDSSTDPLGLALPKKHKTGQPINTKGSSGKFCPVDWATFSSNCYRIFSHSTYVERMQASSICQKHGSNLTSILSIKEQSFISDLITVKSPGKKVWIGGKQIQDQWIWDEGSRFGYTNWYRNEPDSGENCMYIHHDKKYAWHDANCGTKGKRWAISVFLCKKPKTAQYRPQDE